MELYPHKSSLQSIQTINYDKGYETDHYSSLFDQIVIKKLGFEELPYIMSLTHTNVQHFIPVNLIFEFFKRIGCLVLNDQCAIEWLKMLKQMKTIEIDELNLDCSNLKIFNKVVDSDLFNYKISCLRFDKDAYVLDDLTIQNICKITLHELILSNSFSLYAAERILLNWPENMNLCIGWSSQDDFSIQWTNMYLKIKNKSYSFRIYWKDLMFKFGFDYNYDKLIINDENISIKSCTSIKIIQIKKKFESIKLENKDFSILNLKYDQQFIIPHANFSRIKLKLNQLLLLLEDCSNKKNFKRLSPNIEVVVELKSIEEVIKFDNISSLVPEHWELIFDGSLYNYIHFNILFKLNIM